MFVLIVAEPISKINLFFVFVFIYQIDIIDQMEYQLDLFEELDELKQLAERDRQIQEQVHNIRRGLFGRLGKVYKWMLKQETINDENTNKLNLYNQRMDELQNEIKRLEKTISWIESVA